MPANSIGMGFIARSRQVQLGKQTIRPTNGICFPRNAVSTERMENLVCRLVVGWFAGNLQNGTKSSAMKRRLNPALNRTAAGEPVPDSHGRERRCPLVWC
jgi:hypothetical protein